MPHTWRAILYGREVLGHGLIKRVADGSETRIWEDPWIPANPGFKPLAKPATAMTVLVEELIDHDTGSWDVEALEVNLVPADIETILRIPTGRLESDSWAWQIEWHRNFSVRSAYLAILAARATSIASSSSDERRSIGKKTL